MKKMKVHFGSKFGKYKSSPKNGFGALRWIDVNHDIIFARVRCLQTHLLNQHLESTNVGYMDFHGDLDCLFMVF